MDISSLITWNVSIGQIAEIVGLFVCLVTLFNKQQENIELIRKDITFLTEGQKALNEAIKQQSQILTQVAVQDIRLDNIEKRLDNYGTQKAV